MKPLVLLCFVSATLPSSVWAQLPAGSEFQVNTYTTDVQFNPWVASDANGNFVVVWVSYGQDGSNHGVFAQRFSAAGIPHGPEFRVNSYTTGTQTDPVVASDANGNFVVAWASEGQDGSNTGVFGQRFSASGTPQGVEFQINSYTTGFQGRPAVASDASGDFVVVWSSDGQDADGYGIFGQRFNAAGVAQASEFQVNTYTTSYQHRAAVASDALGNFVVVWQRNDGSFRGIFGQRFDTAGVRQGGEFQINSFTTFNQVYPSVTSGATGNFIVAWLSFLQDGNGSSVVTRRFNAAGAPLGLEFVVNSYTTGDQADPVIASSADGDFVVVWESNGQDGNGFGVFGQRFSSNGLSNGSEFQVASHTTGYQNVPVVASNTDGDFVVVWQDNYHDTNYNIHAQRYGDLIFEEGFESGDLSRWSSAQTGGGDLSASGAAGMAGTSNGLQAVVNDTGAVFVQDDTPSAESRYRVRFYFDPNGFDPGEADSHFRTRILIAFDQFSLRAITLVLKRQVGAYSVEARVKRNDGTRADTGFFPITDAPHFIEFDWQRATGPGALDGSLQFWIDDVSMATLTGIDNDQSVIESVRMGALSIKTAAAGTPFYDQFESRRQRLIGAE